MALKTYNPYALFLCASTGASTAELVTTPIDFLKTRLQLLGQSPTLHAPPRGASQVLRDVVEKEGPLALYRGLQPALLRQATYGSLRVGLYEPIKDQLSYALPGIAGPAGGGSGQLGVPPPLLVKLLSGCASGGLAAGLTTDVCKVRMETDGLAASPGEKPRYGSVFNALRTIFVKEGLGGLYAGVRPTVARAAVVAAVELATYDEIKMEVLVLIFGLDGRSPATHVLAACAAGWCSAIVSSPFDVVKSRMMTQPVGPSGAPALYATTLKCFAATVKNIWFGALWKGVGSAMARQGPHCVVNYTVMEQMRNRFFTEGQ